MNNPYRARLVRPRVDHTNAAAAPAAAPITNYAVQNQNIWPSVPPNTQSTNVCTQNQPPVTQSKKNSDSWDWDTDNGNDAWNWSIDQFDQPQQQQRLTQQQQPQQQNLQHQNLQHQNLQQQNLQQQNVQPQNVQQQQRYSSNYPNVMQLHQNYLQDNHHFTNVNGNNRSIQPVPQLPPSSSSRIISSRESTSSQAESNAHYMNYNLNHQVTAGASRPSSTKSNISLNDSQTVQTQWQASHPPLDRQESSRYSHTSFYQPPSQGIDSITGMPHVTSQNQPQTTNYNWNDKDLSNISDQHNWQNTIGSSRLDAKHTQQESYNTEVDPWSSLSLAQQLQQQPPVQQQIQQSHQSHPIQQQAQHPHKQELPLRSQLSQLPQPQSQVQHQQIANPAMKTMISQNQTNLPPCNTNIHSSWDFSSHHQPPQNQWPEKVVENSNKLHENSPKNYSAETAYSRDWKHEESPLAVSTPNLVTPDPGEDAVAIAEAENPPTSQIRLATNKSENSLAMDVTERAHVGVNYDEGRKNGEIDETVNDLSASVNSLNLVDNSQRSLENMRSLSASHVMPQPNDQWSFTSLQSPPGPPVEQSRSSTLISNNQELPNSSRENTPPDSQIGVQQSTNHHPENTYMNPSTQSPPSNQNSIQENNVTMPQPGTQLVPTPPQHETKPSVMIHDIRDPSTPANMPQTGYDQWYNQNAAARAPQSPLSTQQQPQTQPQSQSTPWYPNINRNLQQKQWISTDSSVDSFDTFQPPTDFVDSDVTSREIPSSYECDNRELRESTPKEQTSSEIKASTPPRDSSFIMNSEQPIAPLQTEPPADNYEFASNDRNTFLETGELTDSHHEQQLIPPTQEDENDDVPGDIPFLREVPGQSSYADPRRNDPTGQEQYVQSSPRLVEPRRNELSGLSQVIQNRSLSLNERSERRDVPSGEERRESLPLLSRDTETLERRNDPSGRERSLPPPPPAQSRNDPSGEERIQSQSQIGIESNEIRQVPGSLVNSTESIPPVDVGTIRQIPGSVSSIDIANIPDNINNNTRVVTGSQETQLTTVLNDPSSETRTKREGAVGASMRGDVIITSSSPKRRDSYEDGDDEESANSQPENRERRREPSPSEKRRYDYDRKGERGYYDRDREYDDEYYYDRRRGPDYDRAYNSREDLDRRETSFRDGERRHPSRDDLDERRSGRVKEEDERELRRRDERRPAGLRPDDPRRRDGRDYDPRYPRDPRDREFPDRRRDDRRRRYDEYDSRDPRREYYDDPYSRSSRPSSRSSYNDRDRDYYGRSRDPYYGYNGYGAYDYGTSYNANYYAYLENLRRTNPTAYMEWYHKYYASQHQSQTQQVAHVQNYPEDRASVHSGRSSCEDRTTSVKQSIGDISLLEDSRAVSRMTPTKFSTSHVQGSFVIGALLQVHASYPADGERARIDILRLDSLLHHDPVARELRAYPGPLIKGVTHKKTIIEYCESKIKRAMITEELIDRASYILLYQLMIMLIQQNGNVVGVDIAALLLRNKKSYPYDVNKTNHEPARRASTISQRSGGAGRDELTHENGLQHEVEEIKPHKSIEQMTNEFRNTLLDGLVQQALEYAMNEGLWGHALFLASKLDKRTHASVMTRFANSLPVQDPLQTLYQLHSGRVPASMTCVADWKWDDWRPHLAMVISNASANPEINRRAITTLGDTLAARGDIHAAHFCYILAEIEFGVYGTAGAKLVLIGANHHKTYLEFAVPEAVMLTEIYEYARNLSEPGCTLVGLQTYKLETAQKMVDYGLIEKALLYLEQIAINIFNDPTNYKQSFINDVYTLSDRIKFHDPIFKDCVEDDTTLAWLNNLAEIVGRYQSGDIVQDCGNQRSEDSQQVSQEQEQRDMQWHQQQPQQQQWNYGANQDYTAAPVSMMEVPTIDTTQQDQWQPMSLPSNIQEQGAEQNNQYSGQNIDQYHQQQQDYWNQQQYNRQDYSVNDYQSGDWQQQQSQQMQYQQEQTDVDASQTQATWNYEPQSTPQISMGPSSGKQYDPLEELDALESPSDGPRQTSDNKKSQEKQLDKKSANTGSSGSWFGGLFSKLTAKPKNQMILPDDNNPTIVWDPVAKKWMNKDEDGDSGSTRLAPPPKAADMGIRPPTIEQPPSSFMPEQTLNVPGESATTPNSSKINTGSNMFKLQKGRNMRANYIDVMNPGGIKSNGPSSTVPTPAASPLVPMATSSPQFFIPQPVQDPNAPVDFLTPTPSTIPSSETTSQVLSRWSSSSSLSREVQSYTMRDPRVHQRMKGPMMYNPAGLKDNSTKNISRSRYPPR